MGNKKLNLFRLVLREEFLRSKLSDIDTSGEGKLYICIQCINEYNIGQRYKENSYFHTRYFGFKQLICTCHEAENDYTAELCAYLVCIFNPSSVYISSNE